MAYEARLRTVGLGVLGVLVLGFGTAVAGDEPARHIEQKLGRYTVRYAEGPGENDSIGSYAIHVYGHGGENWITGVVRPRNGGLGNLWLTRGQTQAELRIWVWLVSAGSGRYGKLDLLVFDGKAIQHRHLPMPSPKYIRGYMGHDDYSVTNGVVYRQFPLYRPGDCNARPSGGTRCLAMRVAGGSWVLSTHKVGF